MSDEAAVAELRKLFPVVEHWTYLYNGGIHPCPRPVGDAMRSFLTEWENGGREAWPPAWEAFGRLRDAFARLIGARASNIVITESTTAGINLAAQLLAPRPGQNVVVTDLDFMSNTYPWLVGHPATELRFLPDRGGKIEMADLAASVDEHTVVASICAVTAGSGFRFDLREVHALTCGRHVPLLVDAAQALGLLRIDVNDPPLDFLVGTASKWLMGPAGVGFLYVADRYLSAVPPGAGWLSAANRNEWDLHRCQLHADAMRFQGGIPNLIGVVGALAGLEFLEQVGQAFIERRVRHLTAHALEGLSRIGLDIWTPRADRDRAGIVFFRPPHPQDLYARLKAARIYCGSFMNGIRIDPHFYNTLEEVDRFLGVVKSHVHGLAA